MTPVVDASRGVALVTGGGRGIGAATCRRLAQDGLHVCVNDLDLDLAAGVADEIRAAGGGATAVVADVSEAAGVEALFDEVEQTVGHVTLLVNNAGIGGNAAIRNVTAEYWRHVASVNLDGVLFCTRRAVGPMREARRGAVVTIASRAWLGWWGQSAYAAAKAGVIGMTRALAVELGSRGVRLNVVAPGLVDTPMLRDRDDEALARLVHSVPIGRVGLPDEVAGAVSFLGSERARTVTGQVLYVCGGKSVFAHPDWPPS